MSILEHHFGPISRLGGDGKLETVDVGALIRRLILFDRCTLTSIRFTELPTLLNVFGLEGVHRLLSEPGFELIDDILTTGTFELNADLSFPGAEGAGSALGHHLVKSVALNRDAGKYPDDVMGRLADLGLSANQSKKLRASLLAKSMEFPRGVSTGSMGDYKIIMDQNHDWVLAGLKHVITSDTGIQDLSKLRIEVAPSDRISEAYEVLTNLESEYGLGGLGGHKLVSKALRGISSTVQRIALMQAMDALTGFREDEKPFLESRLSSLVSPLNPDVQENTFMRVVELGGWPTPDSGESVDMEKLLKLRNHPDCVDLRKWFRDVRVQSDLDIIDQFPSMKEKLAFLVHGKGGSIVRAVVTNLADFAPIPYFGKGVSLADKFICDKLLKSSNPVALLSRNYQSIFS